MLVLSRRLNEKLHVGREITVTIMEIRGNRIRIGIEAPIQIPIIRGEALCHQAASHTPYRIYGKEGGYESKDS
ncbi:MAG TPA: carbon storage regulator [Gemmatales bacterium]|nr:carbon storage regulator [Gemmatales bacterium]